jgi:elongation factor 1-beta
MPASPARSAVLNLEDASAADTRAMLINVQLVDSRDREKMGEVAAKIRIMPSGTDVDLNKLKEELKKVIPQGARLHSFAEEPVAFGLKALMVVVKVGDIEGGTEKVEEAFSKVKGVENVSVEELGRM